MKLQDLKGIGNAIEKNLQNEGVFTLHDLVDRFPKRYRNIKLESLQSMADHNYHYLEVKIESNAKIAYLRKNMEIISFYGLIENKKFIFKLYNQRYTMQFLKQNAVVVVYGKHPENRNEIIVQSVSMRKNFEEGIVAEYGIPSISDKRFKEFVLQADSIISQTPDFIPSYLINKYQLLTLKELYEMVHTPKNESDITAITKRLKYQELFLYQAKNVYHKKLRTSSEGFIKNYQTETIKKALAILPFRLTESQKDVCREIFTDLKNPITMQRVLQGDTGSGKTIVAFLAMLATMTADYQVAFMAPTEILASQHKKLWEELFSSLGYEVAFLSGNTNSLERRELGHKLREGKIHGVIGTHALFSRDIHYYKLGLVITDEQHRFGVNQRAVLKNKGILPDVLYLSATPIPRTLAMTIFGDMDVSIIKDKPIGRKAVKTYVVSAKERTFIRNKLKDALKHKGQAFVVAPTIEENEHLKGVKTVYEVIKERYPEAKVGLLHAKLKVEKKQKTLEDFYLGKIDILVSTTVIEVGIDVSNATLMIIYRAERFGYAQLHQLRGRVGRGTKHSECILIYEGNQETEARLKVLETIHDGFTLSEYDLRTRGFGDLLGVMQSGILKFNFADIDNDLELFKQAKEDASIVLEDLQHRSQLIEHLKKTIETEQEGNI